MAPRSELSRLQDFLGEDEPAAVEAGTVVGSVRLERMLGEGGMGSVWIGTHLTLGSEVAVKFMASRLAADPDARARFTREAVAAAQIKSAHVVRIIDHGFIEGELPYIVMELLAGEDLARRLERVGHLTGEETLGIVEHIAKALASSHELGIVHRDIKPGNVFLTEQDGSTVAKLLDFGIAKRTEHVPAAQTATGSLFGTPFYMSPEQLVSAKGVDDQADLWSLAVVAYECLTGGVPFGGETVGAVAIAVDRGAFEAPTALRPELPEAVDAWFRRAFARDRAARFDDAAELAASFRAALVGEAPAAAPTTRRGSANRAGSGDAATADRSSAAVPLDRDADGNRAPRLDRPAGDEALAATQAAAVPRPMRSGAVGLVVAAAVVVATVVGGLTWSARTTAPAPATAATESPLWAPGDLRPVETAPSASIEGRLADPGAIEIAAPAPSPAPAPTVAAQTPAATTPPRPERPPTTSKPAPTVAAAAAAAPTTAAPTAPTATPAPSNPFSGRF